MSEPRDSWWLVERMGKYPTEYLYCDADPSNGTPTLTTDSLRARRYENKSTAVGAAKLIGRRHGLDMKAVSHGFEPPATGGVEAKRREPRGCRPKGNVVTVEIVATSDLLVDDVVWDNEGGWYAVLDSDRSDSTQVLAAPIIDDAGGQDEEHVLYGEWFLRVAAERAEREAGEAAE